MPTLLTPGHFPCYLYDEYHPFREDYEYITLPLEDAMDIYWRRKTINIHYVGQITSSCPYGDPGSFISRDYCDYTSSLWSQYAGDPNNISCQAMEYTFRFSIPDETYLPCYTLHRCSAAGMGYFTYINSCPGSDPIEPVYGEVCIFTMFDMLKCEARGFPPNGTGIRERINDKGKQVVDINFGFSGYGFNTHNEENYCGTAGIAQIFGKPYNIYHVCPPNDGLEYTYYSELTIDVGEEVWEFA
jgi:hypothetical protein